MMLRSTRVRASAWSRTPFKNMVFKLSLKCLEVFAAICAPSIDKVQKNSPRTGRSGLQKYSRLHWRTAPQDARLNQPVEAAGPKVEPFPVAIREGEDEFVASKIAAGWPVDRVRVGKVADRPEPK